MLNDLLTSTLPRIALVNGQPICEMPKDLYIPPDALNVLLETFEGPLDFLLYLIKKQNLDILEIPVLEITRQYLNYIELMQVLNLELAAEYLVMAVLLIEIKSRFLLPQPSKTQDTEEDPRATLIRRLQEYEQIRKAAQGLAELPREGQDFWGGFSYTPSLFKEQKKSPYLMLDDLAQSAKELIQRAALTIRHPIERELLSVRERMSRILMILASQQKVNFSYLFTTEEGKMGLVVSFLAILELSRQSLLRIIQSDLFGLLEIEAK